MNTLSVVLISKNQEWNIARLVESVLAATVSTASKEIVLVDSASTDRTVDIACSYPIKVLSLRPDQRLTSHRGRYVGYEQTSGDFVLFLDGDMELCPGWLQMALETFRNRPDVAVVAGPWIDLPKASQGHGASQMQKMQSEPGHDEVAMVGGAAIYRRSVLEKVGSFNPGLYSDGEPELCVRIRHAGFRVVRLRHLIAYHYSDPPGRVSTLVGRWRRNLYLGMGQSLRYHLGSGLFWPYLRERGYGIVPIAALASGVIGLAASYLSNQLVWFGLWLVVCAIILFLDVCRKRSLYRTMASLVERALIVDGTIRGFLMKPLDIDSCAVPFDVVRLPSPAVGYRGKATEKPKTRDKQNGEVLGNMSRRTR